MKRKRVCDGRAVQYITVFFTNHRLALNSASNCDSLKTAFAEYRSPDVRNHADAVPKVAPFLWQYWRNSHPAKHAAIAKSYSAAIEHCERGAERWPAEYGIEFDSLDAGRLQKMELDLDNSLRGAMRYRESDSVSDPPRTRPPCEVF